MKKSLALALLFFATAAFAQFTKNGVIAHRGAWKATNLPENSIASLQQAVKLGCYGSEFDVHLTKDSVVVVNHDYFFYGLPIAASTYAELLAKKHPNGESIPTLEAYLREGMKQNKTKLILEIKTAGVDKQRTLALTRMTVAIVKKLKAQKWVEYICFMYDVGKCVHTLDPKATIAYLNGDVAPALAKADGYTGLDYSYDVYVQHPNWITEAKALHMTVNAWTIDDKTQMETLLNQKVDFITTNEPELLFGVLSSRK